MKNALKETLRNTVDRLDSHGHRSRLVLAANLAARALGRKQSFSIDSDGDWVNEQLSTVLVSPNPLFSCYSEKEAEIMDLWCHQYTPRPGDTVVDLGAGIGDEAVVFSRLVGPKGRVIAIEAHPHTYRCLEKTVKRSGLQNVTTLHCAVSDVDGIVRIGNNTVTHISNSIVLTDGKAVDVPAHRIDTILSDLEVEVVALLKMNIEGAERIAVMGIEARESSIRHFAISCHDFVADRDGTDELRTRSDILRRFDKPVFEIVRCTSDPRPWVRDYVYVKKND